MVEFTGWGAAGSWHACTVPGCTAATCDPSHRQPSLSELRNRLAVNGCPSGTADKIVGVVESMPVRFVSDCGSGCGGGSCSR